MSVHIRYTYMCPRCGEGINSDKLSLSCPTCELVLGFKNLEKPYTPPYTLTEQHYKYADKLLHVETFLTLSKEKMFSMMNDALSIVETLPAKKGAYSDIRFLLGMAIRIGKMAEAYEKFLVDGGKHVPHIVAEYASKSNTNTTSPDPDQENSNESSETGNRESTPESQ